MRLVPLQQCNNFLTSFFPLQSYGSHPINHGIFTNTRPFMLPPPSSTSSSTTLCWLASSTTTTTDAAAAAPSNNVPLKVNQRQHEKEPARNKLQQQRHQQRNVSTSPSSTQKTQQSQRDKEKGKTDKALAARRRGFNDHILALGKKRQWKNVLKAFKDITKGENGLVLDAYNYNFVISAVGRSGQLEAAETLFAEMKAKGFTPHFLSYSAVIQAACANNKLQRAHELKDEMVNEMNMEPNSFVYHVMIAAYYRLHRHPKVLELFTEMKARGLKPDMITYTVALSTCARACMYHQAMALFEELQTSGMKPTLECYNAAIAACGRVTKKHEMALKLLKDMEDDPTVAPDLVTYNSVMNALGKSKKIDIAIAVLRSMPTRGVKPDVISYNTLIEACGRMGDYQQALALFDELREKGLTPTAVTYATVMSACGKKVAPEKTLALYAEMREAVPLKSRDAYQAVISALDVCGEIEKADAVYAEALQLGFLNHYGSSMHDPVNEDEPSSASSSSSSSSTSSSEEEEEEEGEGAEKDEGEGDKVVKLPRRSTGKDVELVTSVMNLQRYTFTVSKAALRHVLLLEESADLKTHNQGGGSGGGGDGSNKVVNNVIEVRTHKAAIGALYDYVTEELGFTAKRAERRHTHMLVWRN